MTAAAIIPAEAATAAMQSLMRLVDQVKPQTALACYLYGSQILLLLDAREAPAILARLLRLVERVSLNGTLASAQPGTSDFASRVAERLRYANARFPRDAEDLTTLVRRSLIGLGGSTSKTSTANDEQFVFEEVAHAGSWK